ncbi:MAG TPA: hypothetical protein VM581_02835 [Magnetospirillaceae bacterium]|nr:hypothetical protein [Magnetospirillaceae bacterium]
MNILRNLLRPKVILSGLGATLIIALGMFNNANVASAGACPGHDDDTNAVIYCGYNTLDELVTKYNQNPHGDLQNIYGHFGMTNINTFKSTAVHATIYKNSGEIKLDDGTVVATSAMSLGRENHGANRQPIMIGGTQYWYSPVQNSFGSQSLDGYAMLNDDHSLAFVSMKACGNPSWGYSPGYKCKMLSQTKVSDTDYKYSVTPYTKNGATVSKVVLDFGDGQSKTITSNFEQEVSHTYAPGKYTARATVYFMVNGVEKSDTRADCTKPVDVPEAPKPIFKCTGLVAKQVADSRTKFTFTASAFVDKGAVLQSGKFKFDDGQTATVNAVGNTVITTYEYAKVGNHTTTVDLTFNVGKDEGNVKCKVVTKTTPPTCKDTPDAPECKQPTCEEQGTCQPPCVKNPELPECKEIPKTGPAEVMGTVLGLSAVTGAGVYYRNSHRQWMDKIFKR